MRRIICFALMAVLLLSACGTPAQQPGAESAQAAAGETLEGLEEVNVFPKSDCFIGDTMPFYEDGTMYVYYLADLRDGKTGYHPWALMTTQDYCTWEDKGIVIPYGEDTKDQDIALGTGCVMKDQKGLYHAFYTGHNDHYAPKEAIMHATSEDLVNWTKIWQFQARPHRSERINNFDGERYFQPGANGLEIKKSFLHTAQGISPILEWRAAQNGKVNIDVTYVKNVNGDANPGYPDGVQLMVYQGEELLKFEIVNISTETENLVGGGQKRQGGSVRLLCEVRSGPQ